MPKALQDQLEAFTKYETHLGSVRPAQDARSRHFNVYEEADRARKAGEAPPHLGLINIAERRDEQALLKWCERWGLLGIGVHRHLEAGFAELLTEHVGDDVDLAARYTMSMDPPPVGRLRPGSTASDAFKFWRAYSEPVEDIFFVASKLRDAVEALAAFRESPGRTVEEYRERRNEARRIAPFLAGRTVLYITTEGEPRRGVVEERVAVDTLLAFLGRSAVEGTARLARCKANDDSCPSPWFFRSRDWQEYCSQRCQDRQKKRAQRARKKAVSASTN